MGSAVTRPASLQKSGPDARAVPKLPEQRPGSAARTGRRHVHCANGEDQTPDDVASPVQTSADRAAVFGQPHPLRVLRHWVDTNPSGTRCICPPADARCLRLLVAIIGRPAVRPGPCAALSTHRHLDEHQMMLHLMPTSRGEKMRTTINIDDELLAKATKLAGPMDRTAMVSEGLKALIERESARRLARLGGTQPKLKAAPRRREARPV